MAGDPEEPRAAGPPGSDGADGDAAPVEAEADDGSPAPADGRGDEARAAEEPPDDGEASAGESAPDEGEPDDGRGSDGSTGDGRADESAADDRADEAVTADGPKTCAGLTRDGEPCGRRVGPDAAYCYLHEDQADEEVALAGSDGHGYGVEPEAADESAAESPLDDYGPRTGPAEDQEMPLASHVEEMLRRLAVVVAVAGVVSLATFPFAEYLINLIWDSVLPAGELTRPRLYGILELKLTELKVASLAGVIVALPVMVYETYLFMKPGLYPHERRYYLAAIPTSLVLALVGVSFAYFVVLPVIFTYFLYYSQDVATIGFALGRTFDLILLLMGYLAVVFQIPLFILLAMMMGLVTRRWLADRRLLFWGAFLGISFVFSPDPTGMAPIVVALTMIALFEGTLLLTRWTSRGQPAESERYVRR